jgi:hypothetical protein
MKMQHTTSLQARQEVAPPRLALQIEQQFTGTFMQNFQSIFSLTAVTMAHRIEKYDDTLLQTVAQIMYKILFLQVHNCEHSNGVKLRGYI